MYTGRSYVNTQSSSSGTHSSYGTTGTYVQDIERRQARERDSYNQWRATQAEHQASNPQYYTSNSSYGQYGNSSDGRYYY